MRVSRSFTGSTLLVAIVLGVAGSSQAQTITLSASWDTNPITGSTSGGLADFTGNGSPLAANSSLSWDRLADVGVTKVFTFNNPMTATIKDAAGSSFENYFKATQVSFTGAGSTTGLFTQIFTMQDDGSTGTFKYLGSNTVQFSSTNANLTYIWSGTYAGQAPVTQAFSGSPATTTYAWPDAAMNVTLVAVIPEPATLALFGLGLAPVAVAIRRRRK